MNRIAWIQSLAGLPFSKNALPISVSAHAVDQRITVVAFTLEVLIITAFLVVRAVT